MAAQQKLHLQRGMQMLRNIDDSPNNHWLNIQFPSSPTQPAPTGQPLRNAAYPGFPCQSPDTTPPQRATAWSGLSPALPWDGINYVKTLVWHLHIKMGWTLLVNLSAKLPVPTAAILMLLIGFVMGYFEAEQKLCMGSTTHITLHCNIHIHI